MSVVAPLPATSVPPLWTAAEYRARALPANGLTIVPPAPGEPLLAGGNELQTSPASALPTPTPTTCMFTVATGNTTTYPESQAQFLSPDHLRNLESASIASTVSGCERQLCRVA